MIQSKKQLVYDSRNNKSGIIVVEITDWNFKSAQNEYHAKVQDKLMEIKTDDTTGKPLKTFRFISEKMVKYSTAQIDGLFTQIGEGITPAESYSHRLKDLQSKALLIITQQQPIYGSLPEDWEIVPTV